MLTLVFDNNGTEEIVNFDPNATNELVAFLKDIYSKNSNVFMQEGERQLIAIRGTDFEMIRNAVGLINEVGDIMRETGEAISLGDLVQLSKKYF